MILLALLLATPQDPVSPDGRLIVEAIAREPDIVTPTALAIDAQGRIWVIENNTHFRPKNYAGAPSDRIRVFEDFGPDGRARKVSTFAEGFQNGMGLALGAKGEVYLATRSEILVLLSAEDRRAIVKLETTGNYPHNGLSGFAFDARGDLYFALGENLGVPYKLAGSDGTTLSGGGEGGNIYKCRPDGGRLEKVATGFWNTFHLAFDGFGRLFAVDNDPDSLPPCRLLHIIPGGDYGYRFRNGRKGLHPFTSWNGELPGTLPMVAGTGEAPSGIVAYESAGLPAEYRGNLFVTSWGDHVVHDFRLRPRGVSFGAARGTLVRGGEDFRPVGIAIAPDGSVVISDWVDKSYPIHGRGRIWRIRAKERVTAERSREPVGGRLDALLAVDGKASHASVVPSLGDADPFIVAAAIEVLGRPGDASFLLPYARTANARVRVGILLALRRSGDPAAREAISSFLKDADPGVRRTAIQWVAEEGLSDFNSNLSNAAEMEPVTADVFLAYVAAMEFLDPKARVRLDERGAEPILARMFADASKPSSLRALALRLLRADHPALTVEILRELVMGGDAALKLEGVRCLSWRPEEAAQEILRTVAGDRETGELRSWAAMGLAHSSASEKTRRVLRALVAEGSIEAARSLGELRVEAVDWPNAAGEGGDAGAGARVFFHPRGPQCFTCHKVEGRGGILGPDLTKIGAALDRGKLVESILEPSREIAPQFLAWEIVTRDGETHTGRLIHDVGSTLPLVVGTGATVSIKPADVRLRRPLAASLMPEGLHRVLTKKEFRDLVAFLASLK